MSEVPAVTPELPPLKWRVLLSAMKILPQAALSRGFGRIADLQLPPALRKPVLGRLARTLGMNLGEAEKALEEYRTMDELFARRLKHGVRTWPADANTAAAPVDGIVGECGRISRGQLLQAKGRLYTAAELLDDEAEARRYDEGMFATIYLSPRHYHRIHTPMAGTIPLARHVPGALLPVNDAGVRLVARLFARNERLVSYVDCALGRIAVVAVGAYNVGRISAAFDAQWSGAATGVTNRRGALAETRVYAPPIEIATGAEIMAFHLGSTVVLLFEQNGAALLPALTPGTEIRVGQSIARG